VRGDDFRGGYLAASHLVQLGCKRIAYISGPLTCNIYIDRFAGVEKALTQHKIPVRKDWLFFHELTAENARKAMHRLFAKAPYPEAIMAANDASAIAVLEYAKEIGIKVPDELRIVGYSNDPRAAIITPSITTIEQFPGSIGKVIVTEVLKLLKPNGESTTMTEPIIVPVELIRRMST
jgi:LacI family transcriptional regulator